MRVFEVTVEAVYHRVTQVKQTVVPGQARRPDPTGVRYPDHVEQTRPIQRPADKIPVRQVAGVVDLHPGKPFEGRSGDVIVFANSTDGRVRIETPQDWISKQGDQGNCVVRPEMYSSLSSLTPIFKQIATKVNPIAG